MSTETLNILVGFGGVFILGVIGFIIAWFLPAEKRDQQNQADKRMGG